MRTTRYLLWTMLMVAWILGGARTGSAAWAEEPSPTPAPPDLAKTISDGIRLLRAKDYRGFLKRFVHPDDWKEVQGKKSEDEVARDFVEGGRAEELLNVLKYILPRSPSLSDDGTKASYSVLDMPDPPTNRPLVFQKKDGKWYLRN